MPVESPRISAGLLYEISEALGEISAAERACVRDRERLWEALCGAEAGAAAPLWQSGVRAARARGFWCAVLRDRMRYALL
eukprot:1281109-Rhodomonas_salina.2